MNRFRYIAFGMAMMIALSAPMDTLAKKKAATEDTAVKTEATSEALPSDAADKEMGITTEAADEKTGKKGKTEEVTEEVTTADTRNKTKKVYTTDDIDIIGEAAIVIDVESGEVIYHKNEDKKMFPASITKIMTALVALDNRELGDTVRFSKQALNSVEKGSSVMGIKKGERLSVRQSLYVMMLKSANDVAHGLAYDIGGDLEGFAELMNDRAEELGCTKTHFMNASGLPNDDHYTTAQDMALIGKAAYEDKTLRTIMATPKYTLSATNKCRKKRKVKMGNRMIQKKSDYYYKKCIGGKTGYTIKAGGTLVAYAKIQNKVLCGVVLKSTNSIGTYKDMTSLFKYIDRNQDLSVYKAIPTTEKKIKKTTASEKILYDKKAAADKEDNRILVMEIVGLVVMLLIGLVLLRIIYVQLVLKKRRREEEAKRRLEERRRKRAHERQRQREYQNEDGE